MESTAGPAEHCRENLACKLKRHRFPTISLILPRYLIPPCICVVSAKFPRQFLCSYPLVAASTRQFGDQGVAQGEQGPPRGAEQAAAGHPWTLHGKETIRKL